MSRILVAGLVNIETTLRVDGFPVPYYPVSYAFNRVHSSISGVGYNVALALKTLGHEVVFLTLLGRDAAGEMARSQLTAKGLNGHAVLSRAPETAQSVILYDADGRRQIHVDLKTIQDLTYPRGVFESAISGCDLAVLCNINFTRSLLKPTRERGIPIATDVHTLNHLDDPYNRDYLEHANILFMSSDALPVPPAEWTRSVMARFHPEVLVIGDGKNGAVLSTASSPSPERVPAVTVRPVVSTVGAGDALFSSFLHGYLATRDARAALKKAVVFAGHKIGEASAASGFLTAPELDQLALTFPPAPQSRA